MIMIIIIIIIIIIVFTSGKMWKLFFLFSNLLNNQLPFD